MLLYAPGQTYLDPDAVFQWFQLCAAALDSHKAAFRQWFIQGMIGPPPSALPTALVGAASDDEIAEHFDACLRELELSTVLWLVTACEGRLRVDLRSRIKDKDLLATRLQMARASRPKEFLVPLEDEGIFDAWKDFIRAEVPNPLQDQAVNAMGSVKPLIDVRHWLAHGRYWQSKVDVGAQTPATVRKTIQKFFAALVQVANASGVRTLV